jgi:three-Cys-motif partner protein
MGKLIDGDDGLPAEEVGIWAKEKHEYLCRYIDISSAARKKYLGNGNAGATYIDPFCGTGRCKVRETQEWIDGGVLAAWKKSRDGNAPFSKIYIGDLDIQRRQAAAARLRKEGAPVIELEGSAIETTQQVLALLNPYGLHFAFLDPYDLETLDFNIISTLSTLKRIDMLVHISQMDLQRNAVSYATSQTSPFDKFAPGWRDHVPLEQAQKSLRESIIQYWRDSVEHLGVWPSKNMKLIKGERGQYLYWLLLAAKHPMPLEFWDVAANVEKQGSLDF